MSNGWSRLKIWRRSVNKPVESIECKKKSETDWHKATLQRIQDAAVAKQFEIDVSSVCTVNQSNVYSDLLLVRILITGSSVIPLPDWSVR